MREYTYGSLEADEIRLLELHPGSFDEDLECSIHVFRLPQDQEPESGYQVVVTRDGGSSVPNAPPYEALSYVWGDNLWSHHVLKVREDGQVRSMEIRQNLDNALRHLRCGDDNTRTFLWVDAVCINQSDLAEKSTQIPKMALIYNRADMVRVWLGKDPDGNDGRAAAFIEKLLDLDNFDPLTEDPGTPLEWASLLSLMQRPWFNRRWIVQEISLARKATLLFGDSRVAWPDFAAAVALFTSRYHDLRRLFQRSEEFQNHPNYLGEVAALGAKSLVDLTSNLFRKTKDGAVLERLVSLEGLISIMTAFEASSPHDVIYAVLWLAHDAHPDASGSGAFSDDHLLRTPPQSPTLAALSSDEEVSDFEQKVSAAPVPFHTPMPGGKTIAGSENESELAQPTRRNTSLKPPNNSHPPSFTSRSVSDHHLRDAEKHFSVSTAAISVDYTKSVYEVCKDFIEFCVSRSKTIDIICCPWAPEPPHNEPDLPSWITQLNSTPFDRLPRQRIYSRVLADPLVGHPGYGPKSYNASGKTKMYPTKNFIQDRRMVVSGFVLDAIGTRKSPAFEGIIPSTWLNLVDWGGPPNPVPESLWRTLVADRGPDGKSYPPAYFPLACKWMFEQRSRRGSVNTPQLLTSGRCPSIATEFLHRVQSVIWGRQLMLTEGRRGSSKLLGLVPVDAEDGDLICILYGCSVPVVLRRMTSSSNGPTVSTQRIDIVATAPDSNHSFRLSSASPVVSPTTNSQISVFNVEPTLAPTPIPSARPSPIPSTQSSNTLTVPEETPNLKHTSSGVRKAFRKGTVDRQPPNLTTTLESQYQCRLIGECYIHGMMDGEAFKHQREYGNKLRLFNIN